MFKKKKNKCKNFDLNKYPLEVECRTEGCKNKVIINTPMNSKKKYCDDCLKVRRRKRFNEYNERRKKQRKSGDVCEYVNDPYPIPPGYYDKIKYVMIENINLKTTGSKYKPTSLLKPPIIESPCKTCQIHIDNLNKNNKTCIDCPRRKAYIDYLDSDDVYKPLMHIR